MMSVRIMQKAERAQIAFLVNQAMQKQYHCEAHELPDIVLVALCGTSFAGAMALAISESKPFPLETIYDLNYESFPAAFDRRKIVELGRWVATEPGAGEALFYSAIVYALWSGRAWGMGEVKPAVARRLAQMRISLIPLGGEVVPEKIPPAVLPYYLLPPKPAPCVVRLCDAERALRAKVAELAHRHEISFSLW